MGKVSAVGLTPAHRVLIARAKLFVVATAPTDVRHHINVSPKAAEGAFVVLGPWEVCAYLCASFLCLCVRCLCASFVCTGKWPRAEGGRPDRWRIWI
jgi:hypothetical protein